VVCERGLEAQLIAVVTGEEDSTGRLKRKRRPLAAASYRLRRAVASKCTAKQGSSQPWLENLRVGLHVKGDQLVAAV